MADTKQIKAYIPDASGQLVPLTVDSFVLEFPSGDSLEISWETQHPDDPRPVSAQVWGGSRVPMIESREDADTVKHRTVPVALLPSAANLVLIHPYSYRKSK